MTHETPQRYIDAAPAARSNLPDDVVARALWRYAEQPERSTREIADEACVHRRMLPLWARKAGTRVRPIGQRPYPPGAVDAAVDAYLATGSLSEAGRQLGISTGAVRNRVREAGITPDDRRTAIGTRLTLINDQNDGCLSTAQAARVVGVVPSTMIRWLNAGRIPGARLTTRGDGSGRPAWRVPAIWADQHRAADSARGYDELLPAAPFTAWLAAQPDEPRAMSVRTDVSERRISGLRAGHQDWVSFETADLILTAYGVQLDALWPDLEERLANPTTPRSFIGAAA